MNLEKLNNYSLVMDKRYDHYTSVVRPTWEKLGVQIKLHISGDGKDPRFVGQYHLASDNKLPPRFIDSDPYISWHRYPGGYNCWKGHNGIFKRTLEAGLDHVWILEDDVVPQADFMQIWQESQDFLDNNQIDMLYFGWHWPDTFEPTACKHLARIRQHAGGWHSVMIRGKALMERLMNFRPLGSYDWICGMHVHKDINCYGFYPAIATQLTGFSYIEERHLIHRNRFGKYDN